MKIHISIWHTFSEAGLRLLRNGVSESGYIQRKGFSDAATTSEGASYVVVVTVQAMRGVSTMCEYVESAKDGPDTEPFVM